MIRKITTTLTVTAMLLFSQLSFAGATEDLWKSLKEANYPNALTAIAAGADVKSLDPALGTPLNFAACWADVEVVKALIDAKSEINFVAPLNGNTPLMNAASWGQIENVKLLLAAGADIKIKTKIGQTILAVTVDGIKLEMLKLLVASGADPNEKYTVMTTRDLTLMNALMIAKEPKDKIAFIQTTQIPYLLKVGVTLPDRIKNVKESDFNSLQEIASYLLEKGLDPNQKLIGSSGSIIFNATELEKTGIVLALINAKANLDVTGLIKGSEGRFFAVTSVMMASLKGNNELVEALCKAGANLNFVGVLNDAGTTYSGSGDGSHTLWTTTKKNTAVSLANDNGHPDTVALLMKYGGLGPKEIK